MNRIREGRFTRRITQMRLAIKVRISPSKLSYIENGLVLADEKLKRKLARALKVDPAWLFPETGKSSELFPPEER
jgi:transcriptional regulator with XRE-family HTH domain